MAGRTAPAGRRDHRQESFSVPAGATALACAAGRLPAMDLQGRTVAITGASSGIGEATALACARAGAAVALAARREDRIRALAGRIRDDGGRAIAVATDVGEEEQVQAFLQRAVDELGRLDAVVNNA